MSHEALIFEALAGAGSLDENAYLLRLGAATILLDAGSVRAGSPAWLDRLDEAPTWTWISHTHADHAAGLPALARRFVRLKWLTTPQTRRLLPYALGADNALPDPTLLDAGGERVELIKGPRIEVAARARVAGHMLGAASLALDITAGDRFLRFLYLSDLSLHDQRGVPGAMLPDPAVEPVDVMVMEGVLSAEQAEQRAAEELERLRADIIAASGPRLIAASALCQAPQILLGALAGLDEVIHVHELMAPALAAWEAASGHALPARRVVSLKDARALLDAGKIVVVSGEHLEAGSPAGLLARDIKRRADVRIFVLNSLRARELGKLAGRGIKDGELGAGRLVIDRAELVRYEAPLHAPAPDLVRAVAMVRPARLLLVHGRAAELYRLAKRIRREVKGVKVEVVEAEARLEL